MVTLPNLLLTYAATLGATTYPFTAASPNPLNADPTGDLHITPALIDSFLETLRTLDIHITLVSGSWTPADRFVAEIPASSGLNTLVLASETIYSPASLGAFTTVILDIISKSKMSKAIVAAKRVYFGVGGGVDAFKEICADCNAVAYEVPNSEDYVGGGSGVRRCLMEVQMM